MFLDTPGYQISQRIPEHTGLWYVCACTHVFTNKKFSLLNYFSFVQIHFPVWQAKLHFSFIHFKYLMICPSSHSLELEDRNIDRDLQVYGWTAPCLDEEMLESSTEQN